MGFKHLFGYSLVIAGIALLPLLVIFYMNRAVFDSLFLIILSFFAFVLCVAGGIILKRLS